MVILDSFRILPDDIIKACDADDAAKARALARSGRRRHHTQDPVLRLRGPLIRGAYVVGVSHKSLLRTQTSTVDDDIVSSLCSLSGTAGVVAHFL